MTYRYFSVNDAEYAYHVFGEGEVLLLFHGFTGSSLSWERFVGEFSSKYQVITIDLPGHGKTRCQTPRTMKTFSDDLVKLLKYLSVEKVHLLGYSMGGRTALSFAFYYPEMVESLILESASPGLKTEEEKIARMNQDKELANMILSKGIREFVSYWENIPLFHTQKRLPKEVQEKVRAERLMQTEKGLADSLLYMGTGKQPSWWGELTKVPHNVLLIVGEKDEKFVQINRKMAELFPNSELKIVMDAGHAIHIEQWKKFVTIVMEFMSRQR